MDRQREHPDSVDAAPVQGLPGGGGPSVEQILHSGTSQGSILEQNENSIPNRPLAPSNDKFYPMKRAKRGKVVIFNQVFKDEERERKGTEKDVERLKQILPKLGFLAEDIVVYDDLEAHKIFRKAEELKNDIELPNLDCLVVAILTHGKKDDWLCAKDDKFHLYSFLDIFSQSELMKGKPKIFIIQACRGDKEDKGVTVKFKANTKSKDQLDAHSNNKTYPPFPDVLIARSSHHGHYSRRDEEKGSWFIQDLCDVIEQCDLNVSSIFDILTKTNIAVSRRSSSQNMKQISSFHSTLTKKLYFRPVPNQAPVQPPEITVGEVAKEDRENEATRERELVAQQERERDRQRARKRESDILKEKERERESTRKLESDILKEKERERERTRKQDNEWMKEKEQDRERSRKQENEWMKEKEQDRERSRKQQNEWMKEKEQDRERSRKQQNEWMKEKEQDRERIRQQESVWKQERQEERNRVRQQEMEWAEEKKLERMMELEREKQWEAEIMGAG